MGAAVASGRENAAGRRGRFDRIMARAKGHMQEAFESLNRQWMALQEGTGCPGYRAAMDQRLAENRPVVFESPWKRQNPDYRNQHQLGAGDMLLGFVNRGEETATVRVSAGDLVRELELPPTRPVEFLFPFVTAIWEHVCVSPMPKGLHGVWGLLPDPERRRMAITDWQWGSRYYTRSGFFKMASLGAAPVAAAPAASP